MADDNKTIPSEAKVGQVGTMFRYLEHCTICRKATLQVKVHQLPQVSNKEVDSIALNLKSSQGILAIAKIIPTKVRTFEHFVRSIFRSLRHFMATSKIDFEVI
jgi:hypothetical protein